MRNKIKFKLRLKSDVSIGDMPIKISAKESFLNKIVRFLKNEQLVISVGNSYQKKGAIYVTGYISYVK